MPIEGNISAFPIVFESIMCLLMALFIFTTIQQSMNKSLKWLVFAGFAGMVQNVGYLTILMSKEVSAAIAALKVEYTGTSYVTSFATMFVLSLFEKKMPKWIKISLVIENTLVLIGVVFYEYVDFFYKNVYVNVVDGIVKISTDRGMFFYIHIVINLIQMFVGLYIPSKKLLNKASTKVEKNKSLFTILGIAFPGFSYLVLLTGMVKGFDPVPASIVLTEIVFLIAIWGTGFFDGQNAAYSGIVDNLQDPVITVDKNLTYVCSNQRAKEVFPNIKKWPVGYDMRNEKLISDNLELIAIAEPFELEISGRSYSTTFNPVTESNHLLGYTIFMKDLTKERWQMKEMTRLKDVAEQANQAKSDFLSSMSHEIRTPINAIMGMDEMILRVTEESETKNYAVNIKNASESLLSLVNNILDLSKIEVGKIEILDDEYELGAMLKQSYHMVIQRAIAKDLYFEIHVQENLPKLLKGDMFHLNQVIVNVLTNAIKYTHQGGITWTVEGEQEQEHTLLRIKIQDTGIGIKEENIDDLFTAFQRVDIKKNINIEGTGLGLAICKKLIELLGGSIKVESEYGKFSTFIIEISQKTIGEDTIGNFTENYIKNAETQKVKNASFTAEKARILVVDDVNMNLMVVKGLLKRTKAQIVTATSGQESIELAAQQDFDLILMDHMMPGMDGVEAFKRIREQPQGRNVDTPVVILTANAINGMKEQYLQDGFNDYLSKPVSGESLEQALYKHLPNHLIQPII